MRGRARTARTPSRQRACQRAVAVTFGLATQTGAGFPGRLCDDRRAGTTVRLDVARFGTPGERMDSVRKELLATRVSRSAGRRQLDTNHPVTFVLTTARAADSPQFILVVNKIQVRGAVGRPRTGPDAFAGDQAQSSVASAPTCANAT
ncbi:hypothetical protein [Streptomyces wuyuanensis]|uniref:hypothetical protein n=1 Tax=Streptomyces wuyuanensis TaxID=1196353 RepID=UPI003445B44D